MKGYKILSAWTVYLFLGSLIFIFLHPSPPIPDPFERLHAVAAFGHALLDFPGVKMERRQAARTDERDGPPRIRRNHVEGKRRVF